MIVKQLPFLAGIYWLRDGFALFCKRPGLLPSFMFIFLFLTMIAGLLPALLSFVILSLVAPLIFMLLMHACRQIDQETEYYLDFPAAFQNRAPALMLAGFIYSVLLALVLGLTVLIDDGLFLNILAGKVTPAEFESKPVLIANASSAARLAVLLSTPVLLAYWFAPLLIAWRGFSVGKSLFYSFFACLRNWRAFLACGIVTFLLGTIVPSFLISLIMIVLPQVALAGAVAFLLFVLVPVLIASTYVSYTQIFMDETDETDETDEGGDPAASPPSADSSA